MGRIRYRDTHADLNRMILEIVLRDFEPFESIVAKLSEANPEIGSTEVKGLLLALLADDLLRTYLIHADPPYYTSVDATPDTLEWYWFLITEEGKKRLRALAKSRAGVLEE